MNKAEAADVLGCSTRQVEKYVTIRRLQKPAYVRGKRGKEAKYDDADVMRLKAELERERQEVIEPAAALALTPRPAQGQALALAEQLTAGIERQHADAERGLALLESIRDALTNGHAPEPLAEITLKLTLSVAEASRLCGLSKDALRWAINAGSLKAKTVAGRRGWTIKRADLDEFVKGL